jgi:HPt (histidine-containing phosphotransfer) domain-containing protein
MSTSSFDDPELRRIADKFVDNLISRLQAMFTAFSQGDFDSLAGHAHWLKGAGGTVGFGDFTEPARRLETLARQQASHEVAPVLAELIELAKAIQANPDDARSSALAAPTATSP